MSDYGDLIERQFDRLKKVEHALANGAYYADDAECHPLYPTAVVARQTLQGHIEAATAREAELVAQVEALTAENKRLRKIGGVGHDKHFIPNPH